MEKKWDTSGKSQYHLKNKLHKYLYFFLPNFKLT
jgi:hypothetical protein